MNKIIFLDIDGVLATTKEYGKSRHKFHAKYNEAKELNIPYSYNPGCVKIFNEIIEQTNADIVITSDWRLNWSLSELNYIFKFNGINKLPIDVTNDNPVSLSDNTRNRASEIREYVNENKIENYIVIDDLPLGNYLPENRFILTKEKEGLKQTNIKEKIIKILNSYN